MPTKKPLVYSEMRLIPDGIVLIRGTIMKLHIYIGTGVLLFMYPLYGTLPEKPVETQKDKSHLLLKALSNYKGIATGLVALISGVYGLVQLKDAYIFYKDPELLPEERGSVVFHAVGPGVGALYIAYHATKTFRKSWKEFLAKNAA